MKMKDGGFLDNSKNKKCDKGYFLGRFNENIYDGCTIFDANSNDIFHGSPIFRIK